MKNNLEVLATISCDNRYRNYVKKSVSRIDGVRETYVSPRLNTSDIIAFASWLEAEIPQKVKEIERIDGVKKVQTKILVPV